MNKIKIKFAKTVSEIKMIHAFVMNRYQENMTQAGEEEFPLAETYSCMIDMLSINPKLQIYAEVKGEIVGCAVAINPDKTEKSIWLRTICVASNYQKRGLSTWLLRILERNIKKAGFKKIFIKDRERARGFFFKCNYLPFLYISTGDSINIPSIREKSNSLGFKIIEEYQEKKLYTFKLDVFGEIVEEDALNFTKIDKNSIKTLYIFEKRFD